MYANLTDAEKDRITDEFRKAKSLGCKLSDAIVIASDAIARGKASDARAATLMVLVMRREVELVAKRE